MKQNKKPNMLKIAIYVIVYAVPFVIIWLFDEILEYHRIGRWIFYFSVAFIVLYGNRLADYLFRKLRH